MANEYVKTSKEELTAMANELRAVGPFQEEQQFVFPSSEYDENPVYTFKIIESGAWSEITRAEADELIEQGYDTQEVEEFPAVGEAVANTVYFTVQRQLGFAEAYQELIDGFYDKVITRSLTQNDVNGIVFKLGDPCLFGEDNFTDGVQGFTNITEITIKAEAIQARDNGLSFCQLQNLETVNIVDPENITTIQNRAFRHCRNLISFNCSPTKIFSRAFEYCTNLLFGSNNLDLSNCTFYDSDCLKGTSLTTISIAEGARINAQAFAETNLETVYLPDIPITLTNTNAFDNTSTNLKFKVTSQSVIDSYSNATNWSALISKFEVI